ncbi:LLM class flavin-dependent oxidoreductase [Nocardia sp. NPDC051030]|uniref:LLM class flavin-dependent oxidoreductase n=1 Tax=Nocardia sp. NPDC051030 TaxID=3155162 RepID=UPI00343981F5
MKIGIGLPNQVRDLRPTVIPEWATRAESLGFSSLATTGRIAYPGVMDTVALAAAAGATTRIGLISTILVGPVWPAALLAKEAAGIDGVSGGRLTLGLGVGTDQRPDDFVADGQPHRGRGRRLDADVEIYREIWQGKPVGGDNPAVPRGTREIPLLFGAFAPAAYARMARLGQGYIGPSAPAPMALGAFEMARAAWKDAGRSGAPRLVAVSYFAFGDPGAGHANVHDYYSMLGSQSAAAMASGVQSATEALRETVRIYADAGIDELIFNPATDDIDDVSRLAEAVL